MALQRKNKKLPKWVRDLVETLEFLNTEHLPTTEHPYVARLEYNVEMSGLPESFKEEISILLRAAKDVLANDRALELWVETAEKRNAETSTLFQAYYTCLGLLSDLVDLTAERFKGEQKNFQEFRDGKIFTEEEVEKLFNMFSVKGQGHYDDFSIQFKMFYKDYFIDNDIEEKIDDIVGEMQQMKAEEEKREELKKEKEANPTPVQKYIGIFQKKLEEVQDKIKEKLPKKE